MNRSDRDTKQLKIKVINLIELAYQKNKEITTSLIREKGAFTLVVDQDGRATLSGKAGVVKFSAKQEFSEVALELQVVSIMFTRGNNGRIRYIASFKFFNAIQVEFTSSLSIEKLILSCSGL